MAGKNVGNNKDEKNGSNNNDGKIILISTTISGKGEKHLINRVRPTLLRRVLVGAFPSVEGGRMVLHVPRTPVCSAFECGGTHL